MKFALNREFSNLARGEGVGGVLHDFCELSMLVCEGVHRRTKALAGQQSGDWRGLDN